MKRIFFVITLLALTGCASFPVDNDVLPNTPGDPKAANSYGYHPLDPLPVSLTVDKSKALEALPDETIRIAVGTVSTVSGITFGPAKTGVERQNYVVVLDYIKFGTDSFAVNVSKGDGTRVATLVPNDSPDANAVVPVYIGVGLRLTASIYVIKGEVDLGNLFAVGAAAKAGKVTGTLVVQTLGVSGPEISGLIPMPGEISESTIQNAILSLASIKAKIYDSKTSITPRVVGVYNNLGGGANTINGFISSLLQKPIEFPKKLK